MRIQYRPDGNHSRDEILTRLRKQVRLVNCSSSSPNDGVLSTGSEALDRLFPRQGMSRGSLIEWIGGIGGGAGVLSLGVARHLLNANCGEIVVIDRQRSFYPVCAAAWGLDLKRLLVVRPATAQEELWAYDQCLRSEAVVVVWGYIDRLTSRNFRRMQLAAEAGRGLGLLIRPPQAANEPTWADVRLQVEPCPSVGHSPRYRVQVLHCRGGQPGGETILTIDETTGIQAVTHETHHVHLVSSLANPASPLGQTGT
ncbi:MAG: hypothetical protein WD065_20285 [Planctomycetaceae bacterium]